ncbi:cytokine-induced anti-apoptosis inhibitor 1, Fe-S biogenesis-domain-containing protein [Haematococcus lacustris]
MIRGAAVFVSGAEAPGSVVRQFQQLAEAASVTFSCAESVSGSQGAKYAAGLVLCGKNAPSLRTILSAIAPALDPGAKLFVFTAEDIQQQVLKDVLFSGFTEGKPVACSDGTLVQAVKPTWVLGAKAALSIKRPVASNNTAAGVSNGKAWAVNTDDDELLDDEQLLTEEDKQRPAAAPAAAEDCSTSKKACKNCSCGRAEKEAAGEKVVLTQEMLDNPQTNCGSCSLGDAFRCAGCPYRGLPAFQPGKKIVLAADFLTADA